MSTSLFVSCFVLAGSILSSHEASLKRPPYNATAALTNGSYHMKYRDYTNDRIFGNYSCVDRWGGGDKRKDHPFTILYRLYNDSEEQYQQGEVIVKFNPHETNIFSYTDPDLKKPQKRKLIYMNGAEGCQVTKTYNTADGSGCTLWMSYETVEKDPPARCKKVYDKCGGPTKLQYHNKCKYVWPEVRPCGSSK